ncbi:MAG: HAMP domain-containing sensor histidine kinase [Oscillospiraceae bacterium]
MIKDTRRTLMSKYFQICVSIILVSLVILGMMLLLFAAQYFKDDKYELLVRNAQQASKITSVGISQIQTTYVIDDKLTLSTYRILGNAIGADMFLVDNNGKTILCTDSENCNHTTYLIDKKILAKAAAGYYKEFGTLCNIYKTQHFTVAMPVKSMDGVILGTVFASADASSLTEFLMEIFKMFLLSAIAVLIISFIIIYFTTSRLIRPLREMVTATESFSRGDFTVRVHVEGYDEIDRLAMAFNNMASSLATLESTRRSFIANVSHELKTPMTTISGFIDGILDGTIPPEKHNHYLHIVSDEVKRLSRLVRSMLNIARIEAGEMSINPSGFDVNDLICRTVFIFEQAIETKNLEIKGLDVDKIMVEGDNDLIHQVVYNLIENAVKFVNQDGYIEFIYDTNREGGKTYIGIKNSGEGFSKEEMPKLFDRFYKTDKSRSLDKNGVGLGLHIVRSIINLHNSDIMVKSVKGEYCEFGFDLPAFSEKKGVSRFRKQS